jgi:hypothetical protein
MSDRDKRAWQFYQEYKALCEKHGLKIIAIGRKGELYIDNMGGEDEKLRYFRQFDPIKLRQRAED